MKLSIFVPTHYTSAMHYASVFNAIRAADNPDIEVVISDNSESEEKFNILKRFESQNVHIYRGPENGNYLFALEKTTSDYVMPVGDDDLLLPAGLKSILNGLDAHPDAVGGCGVYGRDLGGAYEFIKFSMVDQPSFSERIRGVLATIPWGNPLFHTVSRRDVAKKAFDLCLSIPNMQSFHDHLASLVFASSGPFLITDQPYFIYNFKNWVSLENRISSELGVLRGQNLPPSLVLLQRLMLAVEGFYLLQSKYFSVPDENDRQLASVSWFSEWYRLWIVSLYDGYQDYDEVKNCRFYPAVSDLVFQYRSQSALSAHEIIGSLAGLYDEINGSGDLYKDFWLNVFSGAA